MPRQRQPTDLILANNRKHLSQAEEAERRSHEVRAPKPKTAKPPKWLTDKAMQTEFRKLGKQLIPLGLYTDLDADTLAMYLVNRHQWELATAEVEDALDAHISKLAGEWSNVQSRSFNAARACASDLGLSVSARCKLQIPQAPDQDQAEEDEFTQLLKARQRQAVGG